MTTIAIMVPKEVEPKLLKITNNVFLIDVGIAFLGIPRGACRIKEIVDKTDLEIYNKAVSAYDRAVIKTINIQAEYLNGTDTMVQKDAIDDFEKLLSAIEEEFLNEEYKYIILEYEPIR